MIVTYIRSSSLGCYEFCPMQYYFVYELGKQNKQGKKACWGNVVHKNMELLGKAKLAEQKSRKTFKDDDFGTIKLKNITIEYLNDLSFGHYDGAFPGLMAHNDKKITLDWTHKAITQLEGQVDPRSHNIHSVEEFFEIDIPHDWALYSYRIGDKVVEGRLGIKGTVDLITIEDEVYLHVIDFKTGRRYDWGKDVVKTYEMLNEDKQLLLYFYALKTKYPDKKFYISIYYINDTVIDKVPVPGGLFTFAFGDEDFTKAEEMLKRQFEKIKADLNPKPLSNTCSHFKCKYMCAFSQILPEFSTSVPACMFVKSEIERIGIEAVTAKYVDFDKLTKYDGGGRLGVELKE
jgi:hypothetical protein